jgi:hypothetical protein
MEVPHVILPRNVGVANISAIFVRADPPPPEDNPLLLALRRTILPDGRSLADVTTWVHPLEEWPPHSSTISNHPPLPTDLSRLSARGAFSFSVAALFSLPAFLPTMFGSDGITLTFSATAFSDVRVVFSPRAAQVVPGPDVRDRERMILRLGDKVVTVAFGSLSNKKSGIRIGDTMPNGNPPHEVAFENEPDLMCVVDRDPYGIEAEGVLAVKSPYWVTINPGTGWVAAGKGFLPPCLCEMGQKIMKTRAIKASHQFQHVGFSCWNRPIVYSNVSIVQRGLPCCQQCLEQ